MAKAAPKSTRLRKPSESLGLDPTVSNDRELTIALTWRGYIKDKLGHLKTAFDSKVRKLAVQLGRDKELRIDDDVVAMDAYDALLEGAIAEYAREQGARFFTDDVRTFKLPAGTLSARKQPYKLGFIKPDANEEQIVNQIIETADLLPELDRIREEFHQAFPFLSITLSLDKSGIVNAFKEKTITPEELSQHGLKVARAPDSISSKV